MRTENPMATDTLPPADYAGVLSEMETLRLPGDREAKVYVMVADENRRGPGDPRRIQVDLLGGGCPPSLLLKFDTAWHSTYLAAFSVLCNWLKQSKFFE